MTIKYPIPEDRPWYSSKYWPPNLPKQLDIDYEHATLPDLLDRALKNGPDLPFIWFSVGDGWITYKQFGDLVFRLATYLAKIGVEKGDVIAILLPNSVQYMVAYYAI